jgi:hypothetical protein
MGLIRSLCTKSWLEHLLTLGNLVKRNDMVFNNTRVVTPMHVIFLRNQVEKHLGPCVMSD